MKRILLHPHHQHDHLFTFLSSQREALVCGGHFSSVSATHPPGAGVWSGTGRTKPERCLPLPREKGAFLRAMAQKSGER